MSILSDIKAKLYPEDFDEWEYEKANSQSRIDYLSFEQILNIKSQPKSFLELVLKEEYDNQLVLGHKRRRKLRLHREILSMSRGLMYASFFTALISPFVNSQTRVSETATVAALVFGLSTVFFSNSASKIAKQKIEKEIVSYISSSEAMTIAAIFKILRENDVAVESSGYFFHLLERPQVRTICSYPEPSWS